MDFLRNKNSLVAPMRGFDPGVPYQPGSFVSPIGQRISYLIFKVLEIQHECFTHVHQHNAPMVQDLVDRYTKWRQKYTLLVTQVYMLAQRLLDLHLFEEHKNAWRGLVSLRQRENRDERRWHTEAHGLACAQIELAVEIQEETSSKPVPGRSRASSANFGTAQLTSSHSKARQESLDLERELSGFGRYFQNLDEIPITWARVGRRVPAFDRPTPNDDPVHMEDVERLKKVLWREDKRPFSN